MYPQGFSAYVGAIGSTYVTPAQSEATAAILPAGQKQATVALAGSDLVTPLDEQVSLVNANLLEKTSSGKKAVTVSFNPKTGIFTGSFLDPDTNKVHQLGGAVFQKRALGAGSFYGKSSSGAVLLANGETGSP